MGSPIELLPDDARRVILAINPRAGARMRGDLIERLKQQLEEHHFAVETVAEADQLRQLTAEDAPRIRAVVAAGGDGTVAYIANRTPPDVPLAILPLGTENLLSKHLGLTPDPARLVDVIRGGATVRLDAGQAGERLFVLMAGCGFDADVVRRLHGERRGHISHFSYFRPLLAAMWNYKYPELRVYCRTADGEETEIAARWVFVMNVPRYALGLAISPDARADDGLLNVCTFRKGSLWNGLIYLSGIWRGWHRQWRDFQSVLATEVRIESADAVPFQLDGDPGGFLPVDIRVLPARLRLLVARSWALDHGFSPAST
jgi:diacylglycerol kinase family enzyme